MDKCICAGDGMKIRNLTDKTITIGIGCKNADFPFFYYELKPANSTNHGSEYETEEHVHLDFLNELVIKEIQ